MNQEVEHLEWLINIESLYDNFMNVPYFDEDMRYYGENVF